jgi:hypothetical protein
MFPRILQVRLLFTGESVMKRVFGLVAAMAAVVACGDGTTAPRVLPDEASLAATVFHTEDKAVFPSFAAFIPCTGDLVVVTDAQLHIMTHATITGGRISQSSHFQPMGNWDGVGLNGDKYQATGVTRQNQNQSFAGFPLEFTFVNNFRWIGQGQAANYQVHQEVHVTVNANGTVTANHDKATVTCE